VPESPYSWQSNFDTRSESLGEATELGSC